jgi:hypothetical protein
MNNWEVRDLAIVEADDFQDRYDRNGLNFLFHWKTKFPDFKITLFTIPDRTSPELLKQMQRNNDWIELAVHGWNHESNFECWGWDEIKTNAYLDRIEKTGAYVKLFKAPGWQITDKHSGYIADPETPIGKDPQVVYRVLEERGYTIVDRHYNKPARLPHSKIICVDCNEQIIHMHTWDMETGDKASRNGFRQVEEEHGVPWDNHTVFRFMLHQDYICVE